jgi:hypothetical protein
MLFDLTVERSGLMIPHQSAERGLVKRLQHMGEFIGILKSFGKIWPVHPPQRADEGVSVLSADFAVVVTVTLIKSGLLHRVSPFLQGASLPLNTGMG